MFQDTLVSHAQLDKLLIQTMSADVSLKPLAEVPQLDSLEISLTVLDVNHAISQEKFQTLLKLNVLSDHLPKLTVDKEELMEATLLLSAMLEKSLTQEMPTNALEPKLAHRLTHINFQLITFHAVDAKFANGQDKFQTFQELDVSTDHLPHAQAAPRDNLLTDIAVKTAHQDKSLAHRTEDNATHQDVLDNMKSELLSTTFHAVLVLFAHGHNNNQMLRELLVSTDHLLNAQAALRDNLSMDTLAKTAQLDKLRIQTTSRDAILHHVEVNMISNYQLTKPPVEDANHANGQDKFQTTRELLVLTDHSPTAQTA